METPERRQFARIFDTETCGQVLVFIDNEEGEPILRIKLYTPKGFQANVGITYKEWDEAYSRLQELRDSAVWVIAAGLVKLIEGEA